jgi:hypothetical protein
MSRRRLCSLSALALILSSPAIAHAGMPSFTAADLPRRLALSDLTRARLEAISFFIVVLLVSAAVVQRIWNALRRDFERLPRLSYGKACGVVVLWGLLFVLVLTMVSGARELMTPGAWEKQGLTYRLARDRAEAASSVIDARYEAMRRLSDALFRHAEGRSRQFPRSDRPGMLPEPLRGIATYPGQSYVYVGGRAPESDEGLLLESPVPVLYEGDALGPDRLVVLSDGTIVWSTSDGITSALELSRP